MLIKIRRATSSEWLSANPVLALGELGADITLNRLKIGDGVSNWQALPFADNRRIVGTGLNQANTAITTVFSVAHNLGRAPDAVEWNFECVIAVGGWAVGDRIYTAQAGQPNIVANNTTLYVTMPATTTVLAKNNTASETLNRTRLRLNVKPVIFG